jgi:hypothetical protein
MSLVYGRLKPLDRAYHPREQCRELRAGAAWLPKSRFVKQMGHSGGKHIERLVPIGVPVCST